LSLIEAIICVAREDVDMKVPYILISGGLVVLANRRTFAVI
jgi:hypothetical protein